MPSLDHGIMLPFWDNFPVSQALYVSTQFYIPVYTRERAAVYITAGVEYYNYITLAVMFAIGLAPNTPYCSFELIIDVV